MPLVPESQGCKGSRASNTGTWTNFQFDRTGTSLCEDNLTTVSPLPIVQMRCRRLEFISSKWSNIGTLASARHPKSDVCVSTGRDGIGNEVVFSVSHVGQRNGSRAHIPSVAHHQLAEAAIPTVRGAAAIPTIKKLAAELAFNFIDRPVERRSSKTVCLGA